MEVFSSVSSNDGSSSSGTNQREQSWFEGLLNETARGGNEEGGVLAWLQKARSTALDFANNGEDSTDAENNMSDVLLQSGSVGPLKQAQLLGGVRVAVWCHGSSRRGVVEGTLAVPHFGAVHLAVGGAEQTLLLRVGISSSSLSSSSSSPSLLEQCGCQHNRLFADTSLLAASKWNASFLQMLLDLEKKTLSVQVELVPKKQAGGGLELVRGKVALSNVCLKIANIPLSKDNDDAWKHCSGKGSAELTFLSSTFNAAVSVTFELKPESRSFKISGELNLRHVKHFVKQEADVLNIVKRVHLEIRIKVNLKAKLDADGGVGLRSISLKLGGRVAFHSLLENNIPKLIGDISAGILVKWAKTEQKSALQILGTARLNVGSLVVALRGGLFLSNDVNTFWVELVVGVDSFLEGVKQLLLADDLKKDFLPVETPTLEDGDKYGNPAKPNQGTNVLSQSQVRLFAFFEKANDTQIKYGVVAGAEDIGCQFGDHLTCTLEYFRLVFGSELPKFLDVREDDKLDLAKFKNSKPVEGESKELFSVEGKGKIVLFQKIELSLTLCVIPGKRLYAKASFEGSPRNSAWFGGGKLSGTVSISLGDGKASSVKLKGTLSFKNDGDQKGWSQSLPREIGASLKVGWAMNETPGFAVSAFILDWEPFAFRKGLGSSTETLFPSFAFDLVKIEADLQSGKFSVHARIRMNRDAGDVLKPQTEGWIFEQEGGTGTWKGKAVGKKYAFVREKKIKAILDLDEAKLPNGVSPEIGDRLLPLQRLTDVQAQMDREDRTKGVEEGIWDVKVGYNPEAVHPVLGISLDVKIDRFLIRDMFALFPLLCKAKNLKVLDALFGVRMLIVCIPSIGSARELAKKVLESAVSGNPLVHVSIGAIWVFDVGNLIKTESKEEGNAETTRALLYGKNLEFWIKISPAVVGFGLSFHLQSNLLQPVICGSIGCELIVQWSLERGAGGGLFSFRFDGDVRVLFIAKVQVNVMIRAASTKGESALWFRLHIEMFFFIKLTVYFYVIQKSRDSPATQNHGIDDERKKAQIGFKLGFEISGTQADDEFGKKWDPEFENAKADDAKVEGESDPEQLQMQAQMQKKADTIWERLKQPAQTVPKVVCVSASGTADFWKKEIKVVFEFKILWFSRNKRWTYKWGETASLPAANEDDTEERNLERDLEEALTAIAGGERGMTNSMVEKTRKTLPQKGLKWEDAIIHYKDQSGMSDQDWGEYMNGAVVGPIKAERPSVDKEAFENVARELGAELVKELDKRKTTASCLAMELKISDQKTFSGLSVRLEGNDLASKVAFLWKSLADDWKLGQMTIVLIATGLVGGNLLSAKIRTEMEISTMIKSCPVEELFLALDSNEKRVDMAEKMMFALEHLRKSDEGKALWNDGDKSGYWVLKMMIDNKLDSGSSDLLGDFIKSWTKLKDTLSDLLLFVCGNQDARNALFFFLKYESKTLISLQPEKVLKSIKKMRMGGGKLGEAWKWLCRIGPSMEQLDEYVGVEQGRNLWALVNSERVQMSQKSALIAARLAEGQLMCLELDVKEEPGSEAALRCLEGPMIVVVADRTVQQVKELAAVAARFCFERHRECVLFWGDEPVAPKQSVGEASKLIPFLCIEQTLRDRKDILKSLSDWLYGRHGMQGCDIVFIAETFQNWKLPNPEDWSAQYRARMYKIEKRSEEWKFFVVST